MTIWLLKITVTPVLVALMSLAVRHWGPRLGGLILGLPWMTGPVIYFLGLENGTAWLLEACIGVLLGVVAIAAYILAYVAAAPRLGPLPSLGAAAAAFFATGLAIQDVRLPLWAGTLVAMATLVAAHRLIPSPATPDGPRHLPWWDIPARMAATGLLVAGIFAASDAIGPRLSGILGTYPVILTVIGTFTHHRWGAAAVTRLLRSVLLSLLAFTIFFLVLGLTVSALGIALAFTLSTLVTVAASAGILAGAQIVERRGSAAAHPKSTT